MPKLKPCLQRGHSCGAYDLAGYAVECALKASIARRTQQDDCPPPVKDVQKIYTHDLKGLLAYAELDGPLRHDAPEGPELDKNWAIVLRWSEKARYGRYPYEDVRDMVMTVNHADDGVL